MEKKLRKQFVLTATAAVLVVLGVVLLLINRMNFISGYKAQFSLIDYIAENDGEMPRVYHQNSETFRVMFGDETPYRIRYFTVWLDEEGTVLRENVEHIFSVSEDTAGELAQQVLEEGQKKGIRTMGSNVFVFRSYDIVPKKDTDPEGEAGKMIIFLDSTQESWLLWRFAQYSLLFGFLMVLLFLGIVWIFSGTAVRPMVRTLESQKKFITNAGHELKTPIAVISANAEVLEMVNGRSEWTSSILNQVKRLSGLVNDLVLIAKMDEETRLELTKQDMSAVVRDSAEAFSTVAEQSGKQLSADIGENIFAQATDRELPALVNNLLDNAVKYCDDGGEIRVELKKRGKETGAVLTVSNSYAKGNEVDASRFFDRFYRQDESHSQKKSGYGIGLSMVQSIVRAYRGKIGVQWKDGFMTFTLTLN